jgi:hypothetical protein
MIEMMDAFFIVLFSAGGDFKVSYDDIGTHKQAASETIKIQFVYFPRTGVGGRT